MAFLGWGRPRWEWAEAPVPRAQRWSLLGVLLAQGHPGVLEGVREVVGKGWQHGRSALSNCIFFCGRCFWKVLDGR